MSDELYPLRFREILRNYGFGDRWIVEAFAKDNLPDDHRIAETWEVVDRPGESSMIINGRLQGISLHEAIARYGVDLLGEDIVERFGTRFPLLLKFLDASNVLGEQAHHSDEQAEAAGLADPGKTEAWYMLRTRPGATIRCGNKPGVDREALTEALVEGTSRQCMAEHEVEPDDSFLLYADTMHYSAGGVLFYEIMQNSDVYIGLRPLDEDLSEEDKRERAAELAEMIHLEEGFDCRTKQVALDEGANRRTFILACRYFALERLDLAEAQTFSLDGQRFYVLSLIEGEMDVVHDTRVEHLVPGNSILLPAALGSVEFRPQGECATLKAYVPDLWEDIVTPLRAAGVSDEAIIGLGGHTELNDLQTVIANH